MEIFGARVVAYFALFAIVLDVAYATDPTQLQDFCVATNDTNNALFVNGLFCKDPMQVKAEDFLFRGLNVPTETDRLGSNETHVDVSKLPGLNTLGVSLARIDFAPHGLNPPHIHPRSTEVLTVIKGTLYVAFVTSNLPNGGNKLFTKVLYEGDVFIFPQSLIHFQLNVGKTQALAFAAHSSQNPGESTIANAVFGAQPPISVDVLAKAFQLDEKTVKFLQSFFGTNN